MKRMILAILAAWHGFNGLFMLALPGRWYETVPGVEHTGPFNGHFVNDIGLAFLAAAAGLALAAFRPGRSRAFLAAPAVFLGGHALLHLAEFLHGHSGAAEIARDTFLILVPGLLPAWLLWQDSRAARNGATP
ncbi:MAG: hypothetical protein R3D45_04505 [Rhizobiaceae bacterium]